MLHLIARQIKRMAELREIKTIEQIIDPEHGIGSKDHKDKGTINDPLSFWGHPVQEEILGQRGRLKTLKVYHAFRTTIKNELIRFARHRPLEWHQLPTGQKLAETIQFLESEHAEATRRLRKELADYDLNLETLLRRAIESNLLS